MAESKNTQSQTQIPQSELFGSDYRPSSSSSSSNESSELGALLEVNERLQEQLDRLTQGQLILQEGQARLQEVQEELKEGQDTIITTGDNIRTDISNFQRRTLAGIYGLAGSGGSWLDNCFPPNSARAATGCLIYLIIFFIQLYIFFAFTWFNLCKTLVNITGAVSGGVPVLGSFFRPISQACMILFLLWISTFVLTLMSLNTISGTDQIINIIYFIRQFIYFIFNNVQGQIQNMRNDLTLIADESGLSSDVTEIVVAGNEIRSQFRTMIRNNVRDSVRTTISELPRNIVNVASSATQTVVNGIGQVSSSVTSAVSNMFGLESNQGGSKRGKKSRKNKSRKRERKTRRNSGGNKKITEKFLVINREINKGLKETGMLIKYLLSVMNLFHKLYLSDKEKIIKLLSKHPIVFDFKNSPIPSIQMFNETTNNILTKIKNQNKFKINNTAAQLQKLIFLKITNKGGKKTKLKKRKSNKNKKKKTRSKNKKRKTKKTRRH